MLAISIDNRALYSSGDRACLCSFVTLVAQYFSSLIEFSRKWLNALARAGRVLVGLEKTQPSDVIRRLLIAGLIGAGSYLGRGRWSKARYQFGSFLLDKGKNSVSPTPAPGWPSSSSTSHSRMQMQLGSVGSFEQRLHPMPFGGDHRSN